MKNIYKIDNLSMDNPQYKLEWCTKYLRHKDDIEEIEKIINKHPELINQLFGTYDTPILIMVYDILLSRIDNYEVMNLRIEILELLLKNGADPNLKDANGMNFLDRYYSFLEMKEIKLAINYGAKFSKMENCNFLMTSGSRKIGIILMDYIDTEIGKLRGEIEQGFNEIKEELRRISYQPGNMGYFEAKNEFENLRNEGKKNDS